MKLASITSINILTTGISVKLADVPAEGDVLATGISAATFQSAVRSHWERRERSAHDGADQSNLANHSVLFHSARRASSQQLFLVRAEGLAEAELII